MPELTRVPYLKVNNYVYLEGRWRQVGGKWLENKLYKVTKAEAFNYTTSYIIRQGEQGNINLNSDLSLYPLEFSTMYEIGVGLIGDSKLFIQMPEGKYYYYLEDQGISGSVSTTTEVGGFTEDIIPAKDPKYLREYTIRDMRDDIVYTLVNSGYQDNKTILDFTVNKVTLEEVTGEEYNNIIQNWNTLLANGLLRIIRYPRD